MPDEYGQNRRNSRYFRGSNGSVGPVREDAVQGVLEVGRRDDHRVDVLPLVQLFVVSCERGAFPGELLDVGRAFLTPAAPDVRNGAELEVRLGAALEDRRNQRRPAPIREA